jgi:hypothetical protein
VAPTLRSLCTGLRPAVNFDGILKEREAAETPFRSRPPACFRPAKIRLNSVVTSRATSAWIAAALFSLCCERILHWSNATDPFNDLDKGPLQLPIAAKGLNFPLGFALLGRRGEAFGDRFAIHLMGQPRMWTVARIVGKVGITTRTPTAATGPGNRPGAEIFQLRHLPREGSRLSFQIGE